MKFLILSILAVSSLATAQEPTLKCTKAPREAWLKTDIVKERFERRGHKVKKFTTMEFCYLVEVLEKDGKVREFYVDPQSGKWVKPTH